MCVSENGLKDQRVTRAVRVCKNIVSAFSYSWEKKKTLMKVQQELNLPQHKLKTACVTRWGSMQMMIARVLEQRKAITQVLSEDKKSRHLVPSWADLDVLEAVSKALSPLMEFTDALSGEEYVTISFVRPVLHILNSRVLAEEEDDVELTKLSKPASSGTLRRSTQILSQKSYWTQPVLLIPDLKLPIFLLTMSPPFRRKGRQRWRRCQKLKSAEKVRLQRLQNQQLHQQ